MTRDSSQCKIDFKKEDYTILAPYVNFEGGKNGWSSLSELEVMALVARRPVAAAIYASQNLQTYRNGIFEDRSCSECGPNHAIVIVGYGRDEALKRNFW